VFVFWAPPLWNDTPLVPETGVMATYPLPRTVRVPVQPAGWTVGATPAPFARTLISCVFPLK
jgi:hypothetical protein